MKYEQQNSCLNVDGDVRSVDDIYELVSAVKGVASENGEVCFCCDHNITIPSSVIRQLEKEAKNGKKVTVNAKSDAVVRLLNDLNQEPHKLEFGFQQA